MIGKYIPKTKNGRRFAIGDIHGCFLTLQHLVEVKINLSKEDQLFLLGDYINRGPSPTKVIDFILNLQKDGYQVFPIRGNHEQILIQERLDDLLEPYRSFFENLLYYYETDDFYFVHAGLNCNAEDPLSDTYSMLWERDFYTDQDFLGNKKVVHGHTIHTLSDIRAAIDANKSIIPLDNGCYKGLSWDIGVMGNLCALNLGTFELLIQKNLDRND